jgi:GNAT superfamily N-acetyltransferase
MKIRQMKEKELELLQEIDKEYYDGWSSPIKILKNWFETFPQGFFVAEDKGKIIAYIFVELLKDYGIVPFMHDAKILHDPNGKYMNVSGLGVLSKYKNTNVGKILGEKIIELAKSKGCKQILFIIGEEAGIGGHDSYERYMASKLGFVKKGHIEKWEIEPGYSVTDHWMWIKNL